MVSNFFVFLEIPWYHLESSSAFILMNSPSENRSADTCVMYPDKFSSTSEKFRSYLLLVKREMDAGFEICLVFFLKHKVFSLSL